MSHSDQASVNTPLGSFISQITSERERERERESRGVGWSEADTFWGNYPTYGNKINHSSTLLYIFSV